MAKFFTRLFLGIYSQAGMVATLSGCSIAAVLAAVTGYIAKHTAWIANYGPIGWWSAALVAACIGVCITIGVAHLRYKWIVASAVNKWKERVDNFNPLEYEFTRKRILLSELVPPYKKVIENKTFVECEIIGPSIIVLWPSRQNTGSILGCTFYESAAIEVTPGAFVPTAVMLKNCNFLRCKISLVIFAVPEYMSSEMAEAMPSMPWITSRLTAPQAGPLPVPAQPQPREKK